MNAETKKKLLIAGGALIIAAGLCGLAGEANHRRPRKHRAAREAMRQKLSEMKSKRAEEAWAAQINEILAAHAKAGKVRHLTHENPVQN